MINQEKRAKLNAKVEASLERVKKLQEARIYNSEARKKKKEKSAAYAKRRVYLDCHIGIYRIVNEGLKTVYIGQSINVPTRIRQHKHMLKGGLYGTKGDKMKALQDDYNRFGLEAFKFEQIHACEPDDLLEWETYYCKLYHDEGYALYNHFINTEMTGIFCPDAFKPTIEKLINFLDKGRIQIEQLEQAIWTIENQ